MATTPNDEEVRRAFDAAAVDFTALGRHLWGPIGAATVAAADPKPGDRVLDACCGTGASAVPAARSVGPGGLVDAVDRSGPMVEELRRHASGLPQLHAHQADVTTWDGAGYDVVVSALGIFFLPDMAAGAERLIGAAREGGRVVFTIWRRGAMAAAGRHVYGAVAAATSAEPPPERKPRPVDEINQAEPYAGWLAARGLSDVDVRVNELRLTMTPDLAWLVVLGSGFRGALAGLAPDTVETVRELYLGSLRDEGVDVLDATTLIGVGTRGRHR
ncbi:class I SAM-dependent methyltransferase [Actinosynnema sp. NPDC023658]|uniref:class I SAM-dependent methyltransferase n=1 Tax=Actinosynnema sp. NPDC023658 TaxID=3155465 RepID=UPI003405B5A0